MTADQFAQAIQNALVSGVVGAVATLARVATAELGAHPIEITFCVAAIVAAKGLGRRRRRP